MIKEAVFHIPTLDYCYSTDKNTIIIKVRAKKNDLTRCVVHHGCRYNWGIEDEEIDMQVFASDNMFDYWQVEIKSQFNRIRYVIYLESADEAQWYSEVGFTYEKPHKLKYFQFHYIYESEIMKPPAWVKDAVFYQIFVDRFYNHHGIDESWYRKPKRSDHFGGTIKGITEKIPYLLDLGINAIYLTPVFKSLSNHKYDTIDYYKIDSEFGTLEEFKELVSECHKNGIRIIIDGVFNHCSHKFFAFQDLLKKGEKSIYKNWFNVYDYSKPIKVARDINYECYGMVPFMPKLMTDDNEVINYFTDVALYWVNETGIDGWRLDVATEVAHIFWITMRKKLKEISKDIYILGESWFDSTQWLNGDQLDGVMNYRFTKLITDFVANESITANEFRDGIEALRGRYKKQAQYALMNLLGSHDTSRFLTLCNGNIEKAKMAAVFLMTYVGAPLICYGDEVGMTGGEDPDCRKGMLWNNSRNEELYDVYKKLIEIRKNNESLTAGEYETLCADPNIYVFKRYTAEQTIYIILNRCWHRSHYILNFDKHVKYVCSLMDYHKIHVDYNSIELYLAPYGFYILRVSANKSF